MPNVGDTKTRFGREYIFLDPDPDSSAVTGTLGVWRLRVDDTNTPSPDNPGGGGGDADLSVSAVAGVPISAGQLVYINSSGFADLASASALSTAAVAGMATNTVTAGGTVNYTRNTIEDFFYSGSLVDGNPTNLSPGQPYFLSTTPGNWTTTPDTTTSGAVVRSCGIAAEIAKMSIEIQSITAVI